jgi:arsenate reductase
METHTMPNTPSHNAEITIYHNPQCGTSRNVLAMIRNSGAVPQVVEYLKTPLHAEQLTALVKQLGIPVRDLLRQKGTPYGELGLGEAHWTDAQLIEHMAAHPILMNRPVVVTPLGARLCRPSETVLDILPNTQLSGFNKEDGQVVVPGKAPNA